MGEGDLWWRKFGEAQGGNQRDETEIGGDCGNDSWMPILNSRVKRRDCDS